MPWETGYSIGIPNHQFSGDTPPKINMEPGNGGETNRNLLFQGAPIFRWTMFVLGGIYMLVFRGVQYLIFEHDSTS